MSDKLTITVNNCFPKVTEGYKNISYLQKHLLKEDSFLFKTFIYVDKNRICATDGKRLSFLNKTYGIQEGYYKAIITPKYLELYKNNCNEKYPDIDKVIIEKSSKQIMIKDISTTSTDISKAIFNIYKETKACIDYTFLLGIIKYVDQINARKEMSRIYITVTENDHAPIRFDFGNEMTTILMPIV